MVKTDEPFQVQTVDGATQVVLARQSLVQRNELERVCAGLDRLVEQSRAPRIVISFRNITHLSSTFLGKIIGIHRRIKDKGGQLALVDVNDEIYEVFTLTKLDKQVDVYRAGQTPGSSRKMLVWIGAGAVAFVLVLLAAYLALR